MLFSSVITDHNYNMDLLWSTALVRANTIIFCACFILIIIFYSKHFLRHLSTDILKNFPDNMDTRLPPTEALLCRFSQSAPWNKQGPKTKFAPLFLRRCGPSQFAPSLQKVDRKSKTIACRQTLMIVRYSSQISKYFLWVWQKCRRSARYRLPKPLSNPALAAACDMLL